MPNIETVKKSIEAMSDSEVLVATALASAEIYGQIPEHWRRVAEIYGAKGFSDYETNDIVENELGDGYCLDPELCREWLVTEAQATSQLDQLSAIVNKAKNI